MPVDARKFFREIRKAGCSTQRTNKGHFIVLDPSGNPIEYFAVHHPGNYVLDCYVSPVRKALKEVKDTHES
jgi:hypothetical protein